MKTISEKCIIDCKELNIMKDSYLHNFYYSADDITDKIIRKFKKESNKEFKFINIPQDKKLKGLVSMFKENCWFFGAPYESDSLQCSFIYENMYKKSTATFMYINGKVYSCPDKNTHIRFYDWDEEEYEIEIEWEEEAIEYNNNVDNFTDDDEDIDGEIIYDELI